MKNNIIKVLLIILISETMLVGYSYFVPPFHIPVLNDTLTVKYMSLTELTDFTPKKENVVADSLIDTYLTDQDSSLTSKMKRKTLSLYRDNSALTKLYNQSINGVCPLDNFFEALSNNSDSSLIRIAHYGDSQLEGDRLTYYVRKKFQEKFGGVGVGFVPFTEQADNMDYFRYPSRNWFRYTVFHNRYKNGNYGLSGTLFKFLQCVTDTIAGDSTNTENPINNSNSESENENITKSYFDRGTISLKFLKNTVFNNVRLMYGNCENKCIVNVYNNTTSTKIYSDSLPATNTFKIFNFNLPSVSANMKFEFISSSSPDIYGLFFDGNKGIQVDNYAIRGHSGDGLMYFNPEYLAIQLKETNTRLVIFQFGANVVPYIKSDAMCLWLEDVYYKLFMHFKKANPNLSILVVGAGDMATHYNGCYSSYTYLPKIREAQKNAASRAGCAFWDLLAVMGGTNSILNWAQKKLASYDGHYSPKGQDIIGSELFKAINEEYNMYILQKKRKQ